MRVSREVEARILAATGVPPRAKPRKYRNERVVVDGIAFDSRKEAARWAELLLLQRAGLIADLERQVPLRCVVGGVLVCTYKADFTYVEAGAKVVEDAKSEITKRIAVYRLKKRLVRACLGIDIREV